MQNMWTDNSSTAYSSAEAVKQERIFMIYCCYISKGYKVNNVITFSCPCLWAATNCIWQWPSLPPSLDWETLSWQSPHFQRLKTLFQILNLPLALERRSWPGAKGVSNILFSSCLDLRYPKPDPNPTRSQKVLPVRPWLCIISGHLQSALRKRPNVYKGKGQVCEFTGMPLVLLTILGYKDSQLIKQRWWRQGWSWLADQSERNWSSVGGDHYLGARQTKVASRIHFINLILPGCTICTSGWYTFVLQKPRIYWAGQNYYWQ